MMARLCAHPYYRSVTVFARMAVNCATSVWALIVLVRPYSIKSSAYPQVAEYAQASFVAGFMLALSVTQIVWLYLHWRPLRFGAIGYALQLFFWLVILLLIAVADGPVRAAPLAWVGTGVIICAFAFVANPKKGTDGTSPD